MGTNMCCLETTNKNNSLFIIAVNIVNRINYDVISSWIQHKALLLWHKYVLLSKILTLEPIKQL